MIAVTEFYEWGMNDSLQALGASPPGLNGSVSAELGGGMAAIELA